MKALIGCLALLGLTVPSTSFSGMLSTNKRSVSYLCSYPKEDSYDKSSPLHDARLRSTSSSSFKYIPATVMMLCIAPFALSPLPAYAQSPTVMESTVLSVAVAPTSRLFRANPLTNPLLEQIRIWEQAEADQLKYGGELEAGDAGKGATQQTYVQLLLPILRLQADLLQVQSLLASTSTTATNSPTQAWQQALTILQQPSFQKIAFKKIFNAYGDNIYYADPDRANVYLGGGATPQASQSLAYLYRNDILTHVEDLQAELAFLLQHPEENTADATQIINAAVKVMQQYLMLVPPNELAQAKESLVNGS
jgi:hypothetical protein